MSYIYLFACITKIFFNKESFKMTFIFRKQNAALEHRIEYVYSNLDFE